MIALRTAGCAAVLYPGASLGEEAPPGIRLPAWVASQSEGSVQATGYEKAPMPPPLEAPRPRDLAEQATEASPIEGPESSAGEVPVERQMRQLEHAAGEARTAHALTRLMQRSERVRRAAVEAGSDETADRTDRVSSWAYEARGRLRSAEGRHRAAIDDFHEALLLNESNLSARHALAFALAETNWLNEALVEFSRVLAENPGAHSVLLDRAQTHLSLGSIASSIADCDAALGVMPADQPERAATLQLRGTALHAAGRLRDAATDLNASLRIDPDNAATLVARGHVFAEGGFHEQAAADYTAAVHAEPTNAEAYRALAWLLATCPEPRLRDAKTAVEAAWRARRLGGVDEFLSLEASAAAHAAAGDFAEAIRLQQQALMAAGAPQSRAATQRLDRYKAGRPHIARAPARTR